LSNVTLAKAFKPLFQPKRYKVFYGGRGGAKSWAFAQALIITAVQKPTRILCTREFQGSIRESVHKLLADTISRMDLDDYFDVQQHTIKAINGSNFIFQGLKNNVTQIKSMEGINIVWCEEAEAITDASWDLLIPTVREPGSEIWVSFNPSQETDATYKRFVSPYSAALEATGVNDDENSYTAKVSWRDNPWFPAELNQEMATLKALDHNKYLHVWEGECKTAIDGAIYGEQLKAAKDRITSIPIESSVPVNTFWDLGRNDTTAIWFHQRVGLENRFIDFYESRLVGLDHYARILKDKGYLYGEHFLPHDVQVSELSTNRTRKSTLEDLGVTPIQVVPRIKSINEGIEQTRQAFASCWFDKGRCDDGLKALKNYQYHYDEKYQVFRQTPLHNWASNGADAFRQFGQGYSTESNDWGDDLDYPNMSYA